MARLLDKHHLDEQAVNAHQCLVLSHVLYASSPTRAHAIFGAKPYHVLHFRGISTRQRDKELVLYLGRGLLLSRILSITVQFLNIRYSQFTKLNVLYCQSVPFKVHSSKITACPKQNSELRISLNRDKHQCTTNSTARKHTAMNRRLKLTLSIRP